MTLVIIRGSFYALAVWLCSFGDRSRALTGRSTLVRGAKMGLFLSMGGIIGTGQSTVEELLRQYALRNGGQFEPIPVPTDYSEAMIVDESNGNTTIVYPADFLKWEDVSAYLSRSLTSPVFFFHIHDGDLWMYELFVHGDVLDRFNPIPAYWSDKMSEIEIQSWAGNASVITHWCPDVREESIRRYLVQWDLADQNPRKAYEDDEFGCIDWQIIDFMRKLRLPYPIDGQGKCLGKAFRFLTECS
jgi:hypothetical protein